MVAKFLNFDVKLTLVDELPNDMYGFLILVVIALVLLFGASKIPELFRAMGKAVGEFKKGKLEAELEMQQMQQQSQVQTSTQSDRVTELEKQLQELQKQLEQLKGKNSQQQ